MNNIKELDKWFPFLKIENFYNSSYYPSSYINTNYSIYIEGNLIGSHYKYEKLYYIKGKTYTQYEFIENIFIIFKNLI